MKSIPVTAGVVIDGQGKVLVAQRQGSHGPSKWEFPGGKLKIGESPEECLERELWEELGIKAEVGEVIHVIHEPLGEGEWLLLIAYLCHWKHGSPELREHKELKWVEPKELLEMDLLDADRKVAAKFLERLRESPRLIFRGGHEKRAGYSPQGC